MDIAQPHNTNTQEGALLFALHILGGAEAMWEPLQRGGATDTEIAAAVDAYFPAFLGFHAERQRGFYMGRMPEPFFIWANDVAVGRCLAGPALVKKIRAVLCLPNRTQLE